MVVPLALLGGCGGGGESESGAPSGEEASPAETQAAPEVVATSEAPSPAATAAASPAPKVAEAAAVPPAAPKAAEVPVAPPAAFMQCRSCHSTEPGKNLIGPSLAGVVGRKAGSVPGFNYSAALKGSGITWNAAALDQWLTGPGKMVPGTRMVIGIPDAARRQQIVQYLATLK